MNTQIAFDTESFGSFIKQYLAKFNGVKKETVYLYLAECELISDYRKQNLYYAFVDLL